MGSFLTMRSPSIPVTKILPSMHFSHTFPASSIFILTPYKISFIIRKKAYELALNLFTMPRGKIFLSLANFGDLLLRDN